MTEQRGDNGRERARGSKPRATPDELNGSAAAWVGLPASAATPGARTPEELETLLEDALVLRDRQAVAELFEEGAVLVTGDEGPACGGEEIARSALATWIGDRTYVADPRRVLQVRDLALIVAEGAIHVARRREDGSWRYAISLLSPEVSTAP